MLQLAWSFFVLVQHYFRLGWDSVVSLTSATEGTIVPERSEPFKYWAFISYSRSDSTWADWLHRALESYPVPRQLRGRIGPNGPIPARLLPIFRDQDELSGSADLGGAIRRALAQSRHLIVICSPHAAASRWVNEEISAFQALGRGDRVLCLIVDGEPNAKAGSSRPECFPPAVRARAATDAEPGKIDIEPLAPDVRPGKDPRHKALIRLIAGLLDVEFDLLWQRELRRRRRQHARAAAASLALLFAAALTYVAIADSGVSVPGGDGVRLLFDRYAASMFRRVRAENEVLSIAVPARDRIVRRIHREWMEGAWVYNNATRTKGPKLSISPWVSSQAMTAVFRAVDSRARELPDFLEALEAPFAKDLLIEADGKKFGWLVGDFDYPQAEPALWTVAALAAALGRRDLVDDDRRRRLMSRLAYAQTVADLYRPVTDGGWNILPQQDDPAQHSTYTTALALLALLELRRAGLGWHDDRARLEIMLAAATARLAQHFDARPATPGWRLDLNDADTSGTGEIADGVTLQIYSALLRAEEEAGIAVAPVILLAIPRHIDRLAGRPIDYPTGLGTIARHFTNFDGTHVTRYVPTTYLWHPWAIECVARWLARLERTGAAPETKTQARRVLGHLVVDLGSSSFADAAMPGKVQTFVASEHLYALASLLAPHAMRK